MVIVMASSKTESARGYGKEKIIVNNVVVDVIGDNNGSFRSQKFSGRSRNIGAASTSRLRLKLRKAITFKENLEDGNDGNKNNDDCKCETHFLPPLILIRLL